MSGNDSQSSNWLDDLALRAERELNGLRFRREILMEQVAAIDMEAKLALSILKQIDPNNYGRSRSKSRPVATRSQEQQAPRMALAKRAAMAEFILARHADDEFTSKQIHEEMGATWTTSLTGFGFQDLRQAGFIRKAGKAPPHGRNHVRATLYAVDHAEAGRQLIAEASEAATNAS